ncbi:MAG: DUF421 domain-containing protein [Tissierellaceae bacterium]|nr:DUF421 domain-containing protein [Tissierellaceae bacterium]
MIIWKPTIAFVLILILTRILGKKQMSQMTFFNYVTGITIGSLAANIITFDDKTIWDEVVGLIWWCLLTALLAYITLKSARLRKVIDGKPSVLIKNGVIQKKELKSTRVNIEELSMMFREQGIFSMKEVDYAILEQNGQLSILKMQDKITVSRKDMSIPTSQPKYLPKEVIIDSRIIHKNLTSYGLNLQWLENQLNQQGVNSVDDVFYAEIQDDGTLYIAPTTLEQNEQ